MRGLISWSNLSKVFGRQVLFSGLSGQLGSAQMLVVTGRNGSGKSTFLKLVAGITRPDEGIVSGPADRNAIGYAAPDIWLYTDLTGLENVLFLASVRGVARLDAEEALRTMGIWRWANRQVGLYSSGMHQRLKLACALMHGPSILVLDEPTLALDSDGVRVVEEVVEEHCTKGGCAIIATNDSGEAQRFAGQSLCLDS